MTRLLPPSSLAPRPDQRAGHLVGLVEARLGTKFLTQAWAHAQEDTMWVERDKLLVLLAFLRDDPDADLGLLLDLSAIDHGPATRRGPATAGQPAAPSEIEVFYRLRSPRLGYRLCVSVWLAGNDETLPSVTPLYAAAEWLERELWEFFGVYPEGHPHLRPLLLYPGFSGHPLRKAYPLDKAQPLAPPRAGMRSVSPLPPPVSVVPPEPPMPAAASTRRVPAPRKEEV